MDAAGGIRTHKHLILSQTDMPVLYRGKYSDHARPTSLLITAS